MRIQTTLKILALFILAPSASQAALCSRVHTFSDGAILTASQLNTEFNNQIDCVNSVSDANIPSSASINPKKISAAIAGDGITRNGTTGSLAVTTDGTTIETNSNALRIKDAGITNAKIADGTITGAKVATGSGFVDNSSLEVATGSIKVKDGGIVTAKIADSAVTTAKLMNGAVTQSKRAALGQQVSASCGSFSTGSTSYVDVTNLSVTITTTGRPVMVLVTPDGSGNVSGVGSLYVGGTQASATVGIYRGASLLNALEVSSTASGVAISTAGLPPIFDTPAAGTYVYGVKIKTNSGATGYMTNYKLVAFEL